MGDNASYHHQFIDDIESVKLCTQKLLNHYVALKSEYCVIKTDWQMKNTNEKTYQSRMIEKFNPDITYS